MESFTDSVHVFKPELVWYPSIAVTDYCLLSSNIKYKLSEHISFEIEFLIKTRVPVHTIKKHSQYFKIAHEIKAGNARYSSLLVIYIALMTLLFCVPPSKFNKKIKALSKKSQLLMYRKCYTRSEPMRKRNCSYIDLSM